MKDKGEKTFWESMPKTKLWKSILITCVVILLVLFVPFGIASAKYGLNNMESLVLHGHFTPQGQQKESLTEIAKRMETQTSQNNSKKSSTPATSKPAPSTIADQSSVSNPVSTYTPTDTNTPTITSTPTPTPIPQLDQFSESKIVQKVSLLNDLNNNLYNFLNQTDSNKNIFPTEYLDAAESDLNQSIALNNQIIPNGSIAQDALTNCEQSDLHFQSDLSATRVFVQYDLSGNYTAANQELLNIGIPEGDKATSALLYCESDLTTLGIKY
jgi:hypothetical protein